MNPNKSNEQYAEFEEWYFKEYGYYPNGVPEQSKLFKVWKAAQASLATPQPQSVRDALEKAADIAWNHEPDNDGPIETEIRALIEPLSAATQECEHNWVSARNEHISSGEVCTKCFAIRAEQPLSAATGEHECVYENGDGVCRECQQAVTGGQESEAQAVAWVKKYGDRFHFDWQSIAIIKATPDGKHDLFLAPPSALAIETAAKLQAAEVAEACYKNDEPYNAREKILATIPQDGITELEKFGMKIADELGARIYLDEAEIKAIVKSLIGDKHG